MVRKMNSWWKICSHHLGSELLQTSLLVNTVIYTYVWWHCNGRQRTSQVALLRYNHGGSFCRWSGFGKCYGNRRWSVTWVEHPGPCMSPCRGKCSWLFHFWQHCILERSHDDHSMQRSLRCLVQHWYNPRLWWNFGKLLRSYSLEYTKNRNRFVCSTANCRGFRGGIILQ